MMTDALTAMFDWQMPVALHFGAGVLETLPARLDGDRVVLLTFAGAEACGLLSRLRGLLGDQLLHVELVPEGLAELSRLEPLAARLWPIMARWPETVLLAVGGGTVLDLAKVLRCRSLDGDAATLEAALCDRGDWPMLSIDRLWLVPTTAGTGSEVTRWATLWDTGAEPPVKRSFDRPFGHAERALIDPVLTLSCPPAVLRDEALDALSHALEAIWNHHASPLSDLLAVSAARRVIAALPRAQAEPHDLAHRSALSLAALEAGLAFAQTRTALAHALSYALTLEHGLSHGQACACWLVACWELAVGHDERVDAGLARVFDTAPELGAVHLARWLGSVGAQADPAAFGITEAQDRIRAALDSPRGRNFIAPVPKPFPQEPQIDVPAC